MKEPSLEVVIPKSRIKVNTKTPCDFHTDTSRQQLDTERQQGHTYSMSSMNFREKICKTDKENHLNGLILPLSEKKVAKFFKLITLLSSQITK